MEETRTKHLARLAVDHSHHGPKGTVIAECPNHEVAKRVADSVMEGGMFDLYGNDEFGPDEVEVVEA